MTYTLGLNFLHSDASACIFENGLLIAAIEEERFTRTKHTTAFPFRSIDFCLKKIDLDISKVNFIIYTVPTQNFCPIEKRRLLR